MSKPETEKILGIDLGTTNSAAAIMEAGRPVVIPSDEGQTAAGKMFPSVIAFTKEGQLIVGEPAKRQAATNPDGTIIEIKRKMGTDYTVHIAGKDYTPQQLSAFILQKIRQDAETFLGRPTKKAVITVPAHFNDNQRQATKDAGEIAGFEVARIINEPTAACLAYGLDKADKEMKIMVFSFGGGTHDVTLMEFGGGVFQGLATSGDTQTGGTDIDNAIVEYLLTEFQRQSGISLRNDRMAMTRLKEAAEKAKIELSTLLTTDVDIHFISADSPNPTKLSQIFSTAADSQTTVTIHVLQGERAMATDNISLGMFNLTGIPPAPRGIPQIEVTFDIDANGILNVSAKDLATSKENKITIAASTKLSKDQKEKMVHEAEQFADQDKKRKEEVELRNTAESMLYTADKTKDELKDKITKEQVETIDKAAGTLRAALSGKESEKIRSASDDLSRILQKIGAEIYQKVTAQKPGEPAQEAAAPEANPSKDDNVVDAEFREVKDEGSR